MSDPAGSVDALQKNDTWIDEELTSFAVFVEVMSVASTAAISGSEHVPSMWVERLEIELPFEMDMLVESDGRVRLAGGPPTQYTETTFMPVFHKLKLTVSGEVKSGGNPEPNLAS